MKSKILLILLITICISGCIWIDDDDDDYYGSNDREHIVYINRTDCSVENFIDRYNVGIVEPWSELHLYDWDYEGYHMFHSVCLDYDLEWGPDEFFIRDGETFRIYLEPDGHHSTQSGD